MKIGKVSETVLRRSVLKYVKQSGPKQDNTEEDSRQDESGKSAGIGEDCALFMCRDKEQAALSVQSFCLDDARGVNNAIISALNNVAAGGTVPTGILLSVLLPPESEEQVLKDIMRQAEEVCAKHSVKIMGGHTEVTDGVTRPIITAVGIGVTKPKPVITAMGAGIKKERDDQEGCRDMRKVIPGQDIVASKWIGLEGTALIAYTYEKELLGRYPAGLIEEAKAYDRYLSVVSEATVAEKFRVSAMHDVRNGGIFAGLWELAERAGVGLKVDLKKIPVKQETIEVCEFIRRNPYELLSGGMLLMVTDAGEELAEELNKIGTHAAVIGAITDNNDRIVVNEDEIRFLTPFHGDGMIQ